jgi:hypothetical protein
MPTAHRENGFDFRFYSNDHVPMHAHAVHGGKVCVFFLGAIEERVDEDDNTYIAVLEAPGIRENRGMKPANVRRALQIVTANQTKLIHVWEQHLS